MKKIKSVKLKNDYRTLDKFIHAGTHLYLELDMWVCNSENYEARFAERQITKNETDLFEIEYEAETKSITVKIEYESEYKLHTDYIKYAIGYYNINFNVTKITEVKND